MTIIYTQKNTLGVDEFKDVLIASTLADMRPVSDVNRLEAMLRNANLIVTARLEGKLIGVSRAITDYAYCCYLSDLAVDQNFQKQGIGKKLIQLTHDYAGADNTVLLLTAAPAAHEYYGKIGMQEVKNGWSIARGTRL
ncbi:MAG: GNAT family N-acetyltransferase [Bdellovibrionales bacterium]